jgi:hypothetical protein
LCNVRTASIETQFIIVQTHTHCYQWETEEILKKHYFSYFPKDPYETLRVGLDWLISTAQRYTPNTDEAGRNYDYSYVAVETIQYLMEIKRTLKPLDWISWFDNPNRLWGVQGVWIKIITDKTLPTDGENRSVLVIHPSEQFISFVEAIPNISDIFVVALDQRSVQDWIKRNDAKWYGLG